MWPQKYNKKLEYEAFPLKYITDLSKFVLIFKPMRVQQAIRCSVRRAP